MTRTSDQYLTLAERVNISNMYHTHAFISLHYIVTMKGMLFYSRGMGKNTYDEEALN